MLLTLLFLRVRFVEETEHFIENACFFSFVFLSKTIIFGEIESLNGLMMFVFVVRYIFMVDL